MPSSSKSLARNVSVKKPRSSPKTAGWRSRGPARRVGTVSKRMAQHPGRVDAPMTPASGDPGPAGDEVAALRARVAELEQELAEKDRATAQLVAESQEKLYWLERWHIDLDRVMQRRGALRALETLRSLRLRIWKLRRFKRKILGQR